MSLLKYVVLGAAAYAGYNYATKKRVDGRSLVDDIKDQAPEWVNKAKQYGNQVKDQFTTQKENVYDPYQS